MSCRKQTKYTVSTKNELASRTHLPHQDTCPFKTIIHIVQSDASTSPLFFERSNQRKLSNEGSASGKERISRNSLLFKIQSFGSEQKRREMS